MKMEDKIGGNVTIKNVISEIRGTQKPEQVYF
jgi:hypothetical protein